jgi:hypothetical protein
MLFDDDPGDDPKGKKHRRSLAQIKASAERKFGRFNPTDLAIAVEARGLLRTAYLTDFATGAPFGNRTPVRASYRRIYNANEPLFGLMEGEPWERIEPSIRHMSQARDLDANCEVGRRLFRHARKSGYDATAIEPKDLRIGHGGSVVPIGIGFYVTQQSDVIFQFPHLRRRPLSKPQSVALGSIVQMAYAIGDFGNAFVEIVLPWVDAPVGGGCAVQRIAPSDLWDRGRLQAEIDSVMVELRSIILGMG